MNRPRSFRNNRDPNFQNIQTEWQKLQRNGQTISKQVVTNLASKYHFTWGKWLFFVTAGEAVDNVWRKVAKAVYNGTIPSVSAKVSPTSPGKRSHLICVYNEDFTDREEVMACERGLRSLDLPYNMHYKPDIFTDLNIYSSNAWGLKPTPYTSTYNKRQGTSEIRSN